MLSPQRRRNRVFALLFALTAVVGSADAGDVTYDYDPNTGRLTRATYADGIIVDYEYDNNGNRTRVTTTGANRGALSLVATAYSGGEASGQRNVTVQVRRTGGSHGEARVSYATTDGTATVASGDYVAATGTLNWSHGDLTSKSFSVTVADDTALESDESFGVVLSAAAGAALGSPTTATITIADDEADTIAPGPPSGLSFPTIAATSATATWTAASDNRRVTAYRYRLNGSNWQTLGNVLTANLTGLTNGTNYSFDLQAGDAGNNWSTSVTGAFMTLDTQRPSDITQLTANTSTPEQVSLAWTAATDNVAVTAYLLERCIGASCTDFTQIAAPATGPYVDSGLAAATTYRYRVRARDAANNTSLNWSPITNATTQADTIAPQPPTNLIGNAPSGTQINLTWTAGRESGGSGLAGFKIERCTGAACSGFSQIGTSTTPNYSDGGRSASTTYRYQVRAYDNAGNHSTYTPIVDVTTPADASVPTNPANLVATAASSTQIDLAWTASTDSGGSGLAGYRIERCQGASCSNFAEVATRATNSYSDPNRAATTTYRYRVRAYDGAGNNSTNYTNTANATTLADTTAPSVPAVFSATASGSTQINLVLGAATDEGGAGIAGYEIERCQGSGCSNFAAYLTTPAPGAYANTNLPASTTFVYRARSYDAATPANRSGWVTATAATGADTQAPTPPATITVTVGSSTQLNVSWATSTEQGGSTLVGYELERCQGTGCTTFAPLVTIAAGTTTYSNTNLSASTVYVYRVRAYDSATPANRSTFVSGSGTTNADTEAPTPPSGLTATAASSGRQVDLRWTRSTERGGSSIGGYDIERCQGANCTAFARAALATGDVDGYSNTGLSDASSYSYRVRAYDTANPANSSTFSNTVTVATPDVTAPTRPQPALVGATATTVRISWGDPSVPAGTRGTASTDNVAVTGYQYQIDTRGWVNMPASQLSIVLSGLVVNTDYTIYVRSRDAAGSFSEAGATAVRTYDDVPPQAPGGLRVVSLTTYSVSLDWQVAADNVKATGYEYILNNQAPQTLGETQRTVAFSSLTPGTTYTFQVRARDANNNWGPYASISFTTQTLNGSLTDAQLICHAPPGTTDYQSREYRLTVNGPVVNGSCYAYNDSGGPGAWRLSAADMARFEVRASVTQCSASNRFGSPTDTWIALSSSPNWGVNVFGTEVATGCMFHFDVRESGNPNVIVDSADVLIYLLNGD